jgi:alpha-glucan,water dikinase
MIFFFQVVAGDYAFVLHTTNPVTNNKDEMMGELCIGLGEALVGSLRPHTLVA